MHQCKEKYIYEISENSTVQIYQGSYQPGSIYELQLKKHTMLYHDDIPWAKHTHQC
uniref:Uncharacterized protein n=1 Tax=Zea mays TaxID=4577 RepID=C4IYW0_MAIZE|nr:unknown [Zea mays]